MATEASKADRIETFKPGDGVSLRGLIVSSEIKDRKWENREYRELKVTMSSGEKSFFYVATDEKEELPKVQVLRRGLIEVDYAKTEKGIITVRGKFHHDS